MNKKIISGILMILVVVLLVGLIIFLNQKEKSQGSVDSFCESLEFFNAEDYLNYKNELSFQETNDSKKHKTGRIGDIVTFDTLIACSYFDGTDMYLIIENTEKEKDPTRINKSQIQIHGAGSDFYVEGFSQKGSFLIYTENLYGPNRIRIHDVIGDKAVNLDANNFFSPDLYGFTPDEKYFYVCADSDYHEIRYARIHRIPYFDVRYNLEEEQGIKEYHKNTYLIQCEYDENRNVLVYKLTERHKERDPKKVVEYSFDENKATTFNQEGDSEEWKTFRHPYYRFEINFPSNWWGTVDDYVWAPGSIGASDDYFAFCSPQHESCTSPTAPGGPININAPILLFICVEGSWKVDDEKCKTEDDFSAHYYGNIANPSLEDAVKRAKLFYSEEKSWRAELILFESDYEAVFDSMVSTFLPEVDDLYLDNLTSAEGLMLPEKLNGNLSLDNLSSAEGLVLPREINGSLSLGNLSSAEGLIFPEKLNGGLNLRSLTSAEGLVLPEKLNGNLDLSSLTSAEGLVLPREINGNLRLDNLTSAEGLVLPEKINYGHLSLRSLTSAEKEKLRERYPHIKIF